MSLILSQNARAVIYTASAGQTDFTITFEYDAADAVKAYRIESDGSLTSLPASITPDAPSQSGTLTLLTAASEGDQIALLGQASANRLVSFPEKTAITANQLNKEFDRQIILHKETIERFSRTFLVPPGETGRLIGQAAERAGFLAVWDENGNLTFSATDPGNFVVDAINAKEVSEAARDLSLQYRNETEGFRNEGIAARDVTNGLRDEAQVFRDEALAARDGAQLIKGMFPSIAAAHGDGISTYSALVAGSGGTNGVFELVATGGTEVVPVRGTFTVEGGAVTAIHIDYPGYYSSAPTGFDFSASTGLTGASAIPGVSANVVVGEFFTISSEGETLIYEKTGAATETLQSSVASVNALIVHATNAAALTTAYLAENWRFKVGQYVIFADGSIRRISSLGNPVLTTEVVEAGASADQTGGEIKTLYELEPDTNAFTDALKAYLDEVRSLVVLAGHVSDELRLIQDNRLAGSISGDGIEWGGDTRLSGYRFRQLVRDEYNRPRFDFGIRHNGDMDFGNQVYLQASQLSALKQGRVVQSDGESAAAFAYPEHLCLTRRKLGNLKSNNKSEVLSNAMTGDSWTNAAEHYVSEFTKRMQAEFGNAGTGYNSVTGSSDYDQSRFTNHTFDGGGWINISCNLTTPSVHIPAPALSAYSSTTPGDSAEFYSAYASSLQMFYIATGGELRYRYNDGAWHNKVLGGSGLTVFDMEALPAGEVTTDIEVVSGEVRLCGINVLKNGPGVRNHMCGRAGARAIDHLFQVEAQWATGMSALAPDAFYILLGVNDRAYYDADQYRDYLQELIDRCRAVNPICDILLISPPETLRHINNPSIYDGRKMIDYQRAQRSIAYENRAASLDLGRVFGPDYALYESLGWFASDDPDHPAPNARNLISHTLFRAITTSI